MHHTKVGRMGSVDQGLSFFLIFFILRRKYFRIPYNAKLKKKIKDHTINWRKSCKTTLINDHISYLNRVSCI